MENRYIVKFVNSTWVIFDKFQYENAKTFTLKSAADEAVKKWNKV